MPLIVMLLVLLFRTKLPLRCRLVPHGRAALSPQQTPRSLLFTIRPSVPVTLTWYIRTFISRVRTMVAGLQ